MTEVEKERDDLLIEVEKLRGERKELLKQLKSGELFLRDFMVPPDMWGFARSIFREVAAWVEGEE